MARKKITFDDPAPLETKVFVERDGRMITNEKMYLKDDKSSMIVGVAMAGEVVKILQPSTSPDHMTKIRTYSTNREGFINPKSLL